MKIIITVTLLLLLVACAPPVTESTITSTQTETSSGLSSEPLTSSSETGSFASSISEPTSLGSDSTSEVKESSNEAPAETSDDSATSASESTLQWACDDIGGDMYKQGSYVDGVLIGLIGEENYEAWMDTTPREMRTVYRLVEDFDLSWDDLKGILHESVYTKYIENMPN